MNPGKKAVFLDRDGVINSLIYNPKTSCYESPHHLVDLEVLDPAIEAMKLLQEKFLLFTVSNQPSYAKAKTSLEEIQKIAAKVSQNLASRGIKIQKAYYCHHHPQGVVPEYSFACECRKPKPFFLLQAAQEFGLDLAQSWMIGDQDSDIQCGINAGCQTAVILNPHSSEKRGQVHATLSARNLLEVAQKICEINKAN